MKGLTWDKVKRFMGRGKKESELDSSRFQRSYSFKKGSVRKSYRKNPPRTTCLQVEQQIENSTRATESSFNGNARSAVSSSSAELSDCEKEESENKVESLHFVPSMPSYSKQIASSVSQSRNSVCTEEEDPCLWNENAEDDWEIQTGQMRIIGRKLRQQNIHRLLSSYNTDSEASDFEEEERLWKLNGSKGQVTKQGGKLSPENHHYTSSYSSPVNFTKDSRSPSFHCILDKRLNDGNSGVLRRMQSQESITYSGFIRNTKNNMSNMDSGKLTMSTDKSSSQQLCHANTGTSFENLDKIDSLENPKSFWWMQKPGSNMTTSSGASRDSGFSLGKTWAGLAHKMLGRRKPKMILSVSKEGYFQRTHISGRRSIGRKAGRASFGRKSNRKRRSRRLKQTVIPDSPQRTCSDDEDDKFDNYVTQQCTVVSTNNFNYGSQDELDIYSTRNKRELIPYPSVESLVFVPPERRQKWSGMMRRENKEFIIQEIRLPGFSSGGEEHRPWEDESSSISEWRLDDMNGVGSGETLKSCKPRKDGSSSDLNHVDENTKTNANDKPDDTISSGEIIIITGGGGGGGKNNSSSGGSRSRQSTARKKRPSIVVGKPSAVPVYRRNSTLFKKGKNRSNFLLPRPYVKKGEFQLILS